MSDSTCTPVIVLNWNGWDDTFACLKSLREHGNGCDVWLVDNGSFVDRRAETAAMHPELRAFRLEDNLGWAGGYNRVLQVALREGCKYAYLLNNDCLVAGGFLRAAVETANRHPRAAAIGSYIAYASAPEWLQFDGLPHDEGDRPAGHRITTRAVTRLSGAGMLVNLRAFTECGPFDEKLFCYWEDTEWCARVREAGWSLWMAGGSLLLHRGYGSDLNFNALYYLYRNRYLVRSRTELRFPPVRELRYTLGGLRFASELRRSGRTEETNAIVAGLWDGWTGKYGRRGHPPPSLIRFLLSHLWPCRA